MRHPVLERKIKKPGHLNNSPVEDVEESQPEAAPERLKLNDFNNLNPASMLKLQGAIGNTAVMRLIEQRKAAATTVQRLPASAVLVAQAGTPKRNIRTRFIKTNRSENYSSIITALDQYQVLVAATVNATVTALDGQALNIIRKLNDIIGYCDTYIAAHKPAADQVQRINEIRQQAALEIPVIRTRSTYLQNQARQNPNKINTLPDPRPTWESLIPKEMATKTIDLSDGATKTGEDSGALNKVGAYNLKDGRKGFFKADKAAMDPDEEGMASDEAIIGNSVMGIAKDNPQFANRAIAMYRIDQLLNANVITRTDYALEKAGKSAKSPVLGTISEAAPGKQQGKMYNAGEAVYDTQKKQQAAQGGVTAFSLEDPVYQKAMSKLSIVDALAFQVDRHPDNFFVDMDNQGNVRGVKGIDNDLAFPENDLDATKAPEKNLMGIARYIDKEIAEMVLALQDADLRAVLQGLISDNAINMTINRLNTLKIHILASKANGRLIDNINNWTSQTATAEEPVTKNFNENRGYLGDLRKRYK